MKLEIEKKEDSGWWVTYDGRVADRLSWDEMLGLVASITIPKSTPAMQWLKDPVTDVEFEKIIDAPHEPVHARGSAEFEDEDDGMRPG